MASYDYAVNYFGSPESYAKAIQQKEKSGGTLSDAAAAAAFKSANTSLFATNTSPTAGMSASQQAKYNELIGTGAGTSTGSGSGSSGASGAGTPQTVNYYYSQPSPTPQYDYSSELSALRNAISNMPTVDSIMSSPAMQQMQQAVMGQMDQAMKSARASLAARGVLGEGSTPAAERIGQVAGQYGQQLGALVPQMMGAASQMQGAKTDALQNLIGLLSGMDQQSWQRGMSEFQTYAPYYRFTAGQVAEMAQNLVNTYPQLSIDDATKIVNGWMQGGY